MRILIVLLSLLVTACSTSPVVKLYDGADRPAGELLTVRVPVELEILSINDRRIEGASTLFAYGHRDLQLLPGQYRIVAYYKNLFQLNADQHEIIKSDPALFTVNGNAGEVVALAFEKPADVDAAREMAKHFDGWTENLSSGERIASTPSGLILNQGFIGLASTPAAAETASTASVAPEQPAASSSTESSVTTDVLDALKTHWQQASPEERREFLLWMSQ
jgi:hypothetical protein